MKSPLVEAIRARLAAAGFSDLATPFKIAGVEFKFTGAMCGREGRALDLVLLIDTTTGDFGDRSGELVRQRMEALSRALDITGSRYVVTVILAGATLSEGIEALSETCRVLQVESVPLDGNDRPVNERAERQLDDRIRVLLPLTLPDSLSAALDSSGSITQQLIRALPAGTNLAFFNVVIEASNFGEQGVTDQAALIINSAFDFDHEEELL